MMTNVVETNSNEDRTRIDGTTVVAVVACVYLLAELCFYAFVRFHLHSKANAFGASTPKLGDPHGTALRLLDLVDSLPSYSMGEFLSGFFLDAPLEHIYADNVRSFLAWALMGKLHDDVRHDEQRVIEQLIEHFSDRYQLALPRGSNPDVAHVSMTLQDVAYVHRPLFIYLFLAACEALSGLVLRAAGFRPTTVAGLTFFVRPATTTTTSSPPPPPVLFFHGIFPGWIIYLPLLLGALPNDRPLLLLDLDAYKITSMNLSRPSAEHVSTACQQLLTQLGHARCTVVGHSFGSVVATWFVRRYPQSVARLVLLDPVSILLGLPDVARNFLYRTPDTVMGWIIRFFAARELTIAHSLHRNFFWHEGMLFVEDLPPHMPLLVSISGRDTIINPQLMLEYLRAQPRSNIEIVTWPDYLHGQVLLTPAGLKKLAAIFVEQNDHRHWA